MIFAHLFIGPLILVITLIFVKYPPKKINDFYGYRTSRSMINQDCWDFAQYSTALMWKSALVTCISQLIAIIVLNEESALLTGVIVLIITLLYSVYLTEKAKSIR